MGTSDLLQLKETHMRRLTLPLVTLLILATAYPAEAKMTPKEIAEEVMKIITKKDFEQGIAHLMTLAPRHTLLQNDIEKEKERLKRLESKFGRKTHYEMLEETFYGTNVVDVWAIQYLEKMPLLCRFYFHRQQGQWRFVDLKVVNPSNYLKETPLNKRALPQPPPLAAAQNRINKALDLIVDNNSEQAFKIFNDDFVPGFVDMDYFDPLKQKVDAAAVVMGKAVSYEHVAHMYIGKGVYVSFNILHFEKALLFWQHIYFKSGDAWKLIGLSFNVGPYDYFQ